MEYLALIGLLAGITIWAAIIGYPVIAGITGGITILTLCVQWVYGARDSHK
jgi:hypothetical protein